MAIFRFLWTLGTVLVTALGLWWVSSEAIVPLFEDTVHHEISVTGVIVHRRWGYRAVTECYEVYPESLFATVHSCDRVFDDIEPGRTIVVEVDRTALQKAREATVRIEDDEIHQVCTGGVIFTPAKCFSSRPSQWLNMMQKYKYAALQARAVGSPEKRPSLGKWKLAQGGLGIFLFIGFTFIGGALIVKGRQFGRRLRLSDNENTEMPAADKLTDSHPEEVTGEREEAEPAPVNLEEVEPPVFGRRKKVVTGEERPDENKSNSAPLDRLIARLYVEDMEGSSDYLRSLLQQLTSGQPRARMDACGLIKSEIYRISVSDQADPHASKIPSEMFGNASHSAFKLASLPLPGDQPMPAPLETVWSKKTMKLLPKTAELLAVLRNSRMDEYYAELARLADAMLDLRTMEKSVALVIRHCRGPRHLGESVPPAFDGSHHDWADLLAAVEREASQCKSRAKRWSGFFSFGSEK